MMSAAREHIRATMQNPSFTSFVQGNFAHGKLRFRFDEDSLHYAAQEWAFTVKNISLPPPTMYRRHAREPVEAMCFTLFAMLVVIGLSWSDSPQYGFADLMSFLMVIGFPLAVLAPIGILLGWLFKAEYTVVPHENGDIWILKDQLHDDILKAVETARIRSLRKLTAPDLANSPDEEWAKLNWLRDQEVLSEKEFRSLLSLIA
jgi:hypothetical protein